MAQETERRRSEEVRRPDINSCQPKLLSTFQLDCLMLNFLASTKRTQTAKFPYFLHCAPQVRQLQEEQEREVASVHRAARVEVGPGWGLVYRENKY